VESKATLKPVVHVLEKKGPLTQTSTDLPFTDSASFSANRELLALGGGERAVVFALAEGRVVCTAPAARARVALSPDGKTLAVEPGECIPCEVQIFDVKTGKARERRVCPDAGARATTQVRTQAVPK
jgi:hypothetical protein